MNNILELNAHKAVKITELQTGLEHILQSIEQEALNGKTNLDLNVKATDFEINALKNRGFIVEIKGNYDFEPNIPKRISVHWGFLLESNPNDYEILSAEDPVDLEFFVFEKMKKGWQLYGQAFQRTTNAGTVLISQPMIKTPTLTP